MRDRLLRLHHGVVNRLSRALVFLPCAVLISLCSVGPVSAASAMPNHVPTSSSAFATNTPVTAAWLKIFHRNFMDNAKEQLAFESCRRRLDELAEMLYAQAPNRERNDNAEVQRPRPERVGARSEAR